MKERATRRSGFRRLVAVLAVGTALSACAATHDGLSPYGTNENTTAFCTTGRVVQVVSTASATRTLAAYGAVCDSSPTHDVLTTKPGHVLIIR